MLRKRFWSVGSSSCRGMTSIATTHSSIWSSGTQQCFTGRFSEGRREGYTGSVVPYKSSFCPSRDLVYTNNCHRASKHHAVCSSSVNKNDAIEPEDENSDMESSKSEGQQVIVFSLLWWTKRAQMICSFGKLMDIEHYDVCFPRRCNLLVENQSNNSQTMFILLRYLSAHKGCMFNLSLWNNKSSVCTALFSMIPTIKPIMLNILLLAFLVR